MQPQNVFNKMKRFLNAHKVTAKMRKVCKRYQTVQKYLINIKVSCRCTKHTRRVLLNLSNQNAMKWPTMNLSAWRASNRWPPSHYSSSLFLLAIVLPLRPLPRLRLCCWCLLRCSIAGTKVQLHKLNRASRATTCSQPTPFQNPPSLPPSPYWCIQWQFAKGGGAAGGRWQAGESRLPVNSLKCHLINHLDAIIQRHAPSYYSPTAA